nr:hypothetical protein [Tanacetum cinerariifolium]
MLGKGSWDRGEMGEWRNGSGNTGERSCGERRENWGLEQVAGIVGRWESGGMEQGIWERGVVESDGKTRDWNSNLNVGDRGDSLGNLQLWYLWLKRDTHYNLRPFRRLQHRL